MLCHVLIHCCATSSLLNSLALPSPLSPLSIKQSLASRNSRTSCSSSSVSITGNYFSLTRVLISGDLGLRAPKTHDPTLKKIAVELVKEEGEKASSARKLSSDRSNLPSTTFPAQEEYDPASHEYGSSIPSCCLTQEMTESDLSCRAFPSLMLIMGSALMTIIFFDS